MVDPLPSHGPCDAVEGRQIPLCIDLDGTLLRSDLLIESALRLLSAQPWLAVLFPFWLLIGGKARLKREIADRATIDVSSLPFDERVVDLLRQARKEGRRIVLCSAADQRLVDRVAEHLTLFDHALGSDGVRNLAGRHKASELVRLYGHRGFDYAGNAPVDLVVWREARRGWVVNAGEALRNKAARLCEIEHNLPKEGGGLLRWLKAARLHQWLKNLLVFVPLFASHQLLDPGDALRAVGAFVAFGLCASGVYLLNDLLDLDSDRQHPRKRLRPFAAGDLAVGKGMLAALLLASAGLGMALVVSPAFMLVLGGYYLITLAYSVRLKRVAILDVMILAALYTVRIIGGAVAIGVVLSFWLLAFSVFLFLSLALLKRYAELVLVQAEGKTFALGRGYGTDDLPLVQSMGAASGYASVLVLALYINSPESQVLYSHPQVLWLICPVALYWITRAWMITHRGGMHDDPVVFAVRDRVSQGLAAASVAFVVAAI